MPGLGAVSLMLVWAAHDGGYDADTWYWAALMLVAATAAVWIGSGPSPRSLPRPLVFALIAFTAYVVFSYVSISWSASPGDALEGSNKALLYLLLFTFLARLPWTSHAALAMLVVFAVGVGVVAVVLLVRLASADHVGALVIGGRLAAPTGYINSTAALFTIEAFTGTALASRPELPSPLRGALAGFAGAGLELAVIVQSRGWLFTLPLVAIVAAAVVRDRMRFAAFAALPVAAALVPLHRLLAVYQSSPSVGLEHAAARAGKAGLLVCGAVLVVGTLAAWADGRRRPRIANAARRRVIGGLVIVVVAVAAASGSIAATHGHPVGFVVRQWNGFSHPQTKASSTSHFADVGSGRYDFWRVAVEAFRAHPVGGLGQDNFADYYITRRRTREDPQYTHSIEMRLLAHTGVVGFMTFAAFLVAALAAALRTRRRASGLTQAVTGVALLPLVIWLIHGSVDWFWEMPALSGPALGFLAVAGALSRSPSEPKRDLARPGSTAAVWCATGAGAVALVAAAVALGFPYLSVREVSIASDLRRSNPVAALQALRMAARLNPLTADPGRLGGTIALENGRYLDAERRFAQAAQRDPGGWYAWLGAGLAASALGRPAAAHHDFEVADSINRDEPVIKQALARVYGPHRLTPEDALNLLIQTERL